MVIPKSVATKDAPARKADAVFLTTDMYAQRDDRYFKAHDFFERSIANRPEKFGSLVQVLSSYESRNAKDDDKPFSRGADSIQIVYAPGRFWIASLVFDDERPGLTLPKNISSNIPRGVKAREPNAFEHERIVRDVS